MKKLDLQRLLFVFLSGVYLFVSQGDFSRDVLWFLPLIFLVSCLWAPSSSSSFKFDFVYLGLLLLGLGSVLISLSLLLSTQAQVGVGWGILCSLLGASGAIVCSFVGARYKNISSFRFGFFLSLFFVTLTALLLAFLAKTPLGLSDFSVWSQIFAFARTWDFRYLLIFFHALTVYFLYRSRAGNDFTALAPSFLFLIFPLLPHTLNGVWNDSFALLLVMLAFLFLQRGQRKSFFVVLTVLVLSSPLYFLFVPLFYLFKKAQHKNSWWQFFLRSSLLPLVFYFLVCVFDKSFTADFVRDLTEFIEKPHLQALEYFLGADIFHSWFVALDSFKGLLVALLAILIFRFSWRNLFLFLFFIFFAFPLSGHLWLVLGSLFLFFIFADRDEKSYVAQMEWPLFSFWATRLFVIMALPLRYTDLTYYFWVSSKLMHKQIPYYNFSFEYPPLALGPIYIPRLFIELFGAADFAVYRWAHLWLYFICDLLFFRFLSAKKKEGAVTSAGLWIYIFGGLCMGELIYDRLDLLFGIILALMMCWAWERKYFDAIFIGMVGVFFKLLTVITFPLLLIDIFKTEPSVKKRALWASTGVLMFGVFFAASYGLFQERFLTFLRYHQARGLQVESLWSSLDFFATLLMPKAFSVFQTVSNYGALHVLNAPSAFLYLATWVPVVLLLLLYWSYWQSSRKNPPEKIVKRYFFLAVLIFITFGKVLSPQYMIWLLCLYPLCQFDMKDKIDRLQSFLLVLALVMSFFLFHFYLYLRDFAVGMWVLLLLRNLVLVTMVVIELWYLPQLPENK